MESWGQGVTMVAVWFPWFQDRSLYHPVSNSCVDSSPSEHRVFMSTCSPSSPGQQWLFEKTNATVLDHFNPGPD